MIAHDLDMTEVVACRRPKSVLDVRFLNHQEDVSLQHKLKLLDMRHRYILKALCQEKDSLIRNHKKLLHLKVCEPRATINITMKELHETKMSRMACAASAPENRRLYSSRSHSNNRANIVQRCQTSHANVTVEDPQTTELDTKGTPVQSLRSQSAQPKSIHSAKHRETRIVHSSNQRETESRAGVFSFIQLKQMSTIDSISEKELARQQLQSRGEKERLKQHQRDMLSQKIHTFLKALENNQQLENKTP
ncbi:hypothetical protein DPEC_G00290560 [Dallia pectoralis]|uniref:Uncharacterized protein n=1 Tax=Dallia pectoralis TaxID=75939 RepID=A0ACC2FHE8_DALPE|nr:hypothetical protein DPEC_G00290560 [Dallia pectoralis]